MKNDKNQNSNNKYEGVYSNPDFMYANTSLIGTLANIVHKDGNIYEGVFNTFSSEVKINYFVIIYIIFILLIHFCFFFFQFILV